MRIVAVGLVLAVVGALAAAIADVTVPFATIGHGSYSRAPLADGLTVLPTQPPCGPPSGSPCAARFAYAPNQKLTVWFSVRNESRVPLTLDGVPQRSFDQFPSEPLMGPVAVFDGGDPVRGSPGAMDGIPFRAVVLAPLEERWVGVEFRTMADVAYACAHWKTGIGVGWDRIPVVWHWLATEHETQINLAKPNGPLHHIPNANTQSLARGQEKGHEEREVPLPAAERHKALAAQRILRRWARLGSSLSCW